MAEVPGVSGAGYTGSHMEKCPYRRITVSWYWTAFLQGSGMRYSMGQCVQGDLADTEHTERVFQEHRVSAVLHSAALSQVGESVQVPARCYRNNAVNTLDLLDAMGRNGIRNFNAAGADPAGAMGERHNPESHLIPLLLQAANGRREHIAVFGNGYPILDGACIRDHSMSRNFCTAHLLALEYLLRGGGSLSLNPGKAQASPYRPSAI